MAATYEPIASVTLASAASSVTISAIPGSFTDLIAICVGQGTTSDNDANSLRFNADTGSNYSRTRLIGDGSSASSARSSNITEMFFQRMATSAHSSKSILKAQIMSYANTNVYKTVLGQTSTPEAIIGLDVGLWRSTSAITSVTWLRNGGRNIAAGSTFSLFGIKAA